MPFVHAALDEDLLEYTYLTTHGLAAVNILDQIEVVIFAAYR